MRNIYSFILFISLLFPTVVEAFHVLYDSHDTSISEVANIDDSKLECQISLFSNQEDDTDFFHNMFMNHLHLTSLVILFIGIIHYLLKQITNLPKKEAHLIWLNY